MSNSCSNFYCIISPGWKVNPENKMTVKQTKKCAEGGGKDADDQRGSAAAKDLPCRPILFISAWRKQPTQWSFTMPTACMKA